MERKLPLVLLVLLCGVFVFTFAWTPESRLNWLLELGPGLLGAAVLVATWRRFPLSSFVYVCIFVHVLILAYGGFYTYAKAPLGEWMKLLTGSTRNDYDKIGHFAFGFFPVFTLREVYLRLGLMKDGGWLNFTLVSVIGGFAALYELIEWWAALALDPEGGDAFLGTQGDIWDAQKDMAYAIAGAALGLLLLRKLHQKSIEALGVSAGAPRPR